MSPDDTAGCILIFTVTLFHTVIDTVQCVHTTPADYVLHEETNIIA